jgi:predicted ATP-grasp superfamily ATP-dependent carboligase
LLKILVYEHVSGGGYAGHPLNPSVLSEGFGMLRCLAQDFKSAGHEVTVLLDAHISKLNPPIAADCTAPVLFAREAEKFLVNASKINDAVYIIAPETGHTLQSLVNLVEKTGKLSLNCESETIQKVADKAVLYETLKNSGLSMPETMTFNMDADFDEIKGEIKSKLNYPVVFKPLDGVSCGGFSIVQEARQVRNAIANTRSVSSRKSLIVQEFVRGEPVSVSLLCTGAKASAISLNKQNIQLAQPEGVSSYEGGIVPFDHALKPEAFKTAEKVVSSFSGLSGYIGVDLVLTQNKSFVVDVNPRLTTSYVGIRGITGFNIAEAIVNARLKDSFPSRQETVGFVYFSKVRASKPSIGAFHKAAQIDGVVSPPFPLNGKSEAIALVAGRGESIPGAQLRFEESKKRLLNIIKRGK